MKKLISYLALSLLLISCASKQMASTAVEAPRQPAATKEDMSGHYLGEGLFSSREEGLTRPALRFYLNRAEGEADTYYAVLLEYDNLHSLFSMIGPYLLGKFEKLQNVNGDLKISTRISAYKVVPTGGTPGVYHMWNLSVDNGQIVPVKTSNLFLKLDRDNKEENPLAGATIVGNPDGEIRFPNKSQKTDKGFFGSVFDHLSLTQYELASFAYAKAHLSSSWRGNWEDLEGSYLSGYGRTKDGVLELYSQGSEKRMEFIKSNRTKPKNFTNPKSAHLVGNYVVSEPVPKMYLTKSADGMQRMSAEQLKGRIGLFLDVFDASAPEAGSQMVTELAFINPKDPADFLMYYEHPEHLKRIGVLPPKK